MGNAKSTYLALTLIAVLGYWCAPLATQAQARVYTVQVAAFQSQESAETLTNDLRAQGLEAYWIKATMLGNGTCYRVRIGKFLSRHSARDYAERMRRVGLLD